jgi:hypothetical protein
MNLIKYDEGDFYFVDMDEESKTYMGMFIKIKDEEPKMLYIMDQFKFLKFRHLYYHTIYRNEEYIKNLEKRLKELKEVNSEKNEI